MQNQNTKLINESFIPMNNRLQGEEERQLLIEKLQNCHLIQQDKGLAEKFAKVGEIIEFQNDEILIVDGAEDTDVYFILEGEAEVLIKNNRVAVRKSGDTIGEMAMVDPSAPRSATVKAMGNVIALKVTELEFTPIADEHPHLWRSIAKAGFDLLRKRSANEPN
jgi:CRP-like cAMP-binding protein